MVKISILVAFFCVNVDARDILNELLFCKKTLYPPGN